MKATRGRPLGLLGWLVWMALERMAGGLAAPDAEVGARSA